MATKGNRDDRKTVDVPPTGNRNADPLSDQSGAHPVETGVGAALGGAAAGLAVGAVAGPVGAAIGAAVGAVAGGLAGKGVGEAIDPTVDDDYLRENFTTRKYVKKGETFDTYAPVYQYGGVAATKYEGRDYDEVEADLRRDYEASEAHAAIPWERAKPAVRDAYDRTIQLREEHLNVGKTQVETGKVNVRKEVTTRTQTIDVPVEHEEVVIERRAVKGGKVSGDMVAEEIRIPVKEERVHVTKEAVVKEEVSVGKRKVQGTERVSETVSEEELKIDNEGSVRVHKEGFDRPAKK